MRIVNSMLSVLAALFLAAWFGYFLTHYLGDNPKYWKLEESTILVGGTAASIVCLVAIIAGILRRRAIDGYAIDLLHRAGGCQSTNSEQCLATLAALVALANHVGFSFSVFARASHANLDRLASLFHVSPHQEYYSAILAEQRKLCTRGAMVEPQAAVPNVDAPGT